MVLNCRICTVAALTLLILSAATPLKAQVLLDDVPMEDVLAALGAIHPAARTGAETYRQAFRMRCGRDLTAIELRHALEDGSGDPVLLGLMHAEQANDADARRRLVNGITCGRRV